MRLSLLIFCATLVVVLLLSYADCESKNANIGIYEEHANNIIGIANRQMQGIWKRRREIFLSLAKGRGFNVINQGPMKQETDNAYRRLMYELAANVSVVPVREIKNHLLRRQVQRLSKLQLYGLDDADYDEAKEMLHRMQTFITSRLVCGVQQADDCVPVAMVPTITMHSIRSRRIDELEYYWEKWREALSEHDEAKSTFINYVRLLRIAASYNGHVTPSRTWYLHYETDNFQAELEEVIWEIMPLYKELHAYLRHWARIVYHTRMTEADDPIPAPILDQMIQQAWYVRTIFRTPYPKNQLPQVQPKIEEVLVSPLQTIEKAAAFFQSLGLKPLPSSFYQKYVRRISDDEAGPDCKSEVYYFPPEIGMRYCPKLDYKTLMQVHGVMADLNYNIYKKELPFGLDREPCPGFGSAIGETVVIASGTSRHLHRLHILTNDSLSAEQSMNRLFRMGVHTLLAIPQYFINEKFLVDVMDGRIGPHEYNCGYWRLQNKYAGVVPPSHRSELNFDPDFKFYRGLNPDKPNTVKFLSEVLGLSFYRSFCLASMQYQPGNPDYPLHNCDFHGSTAAGELIHKMMKLGATQHWRDVMELGTGERRLNGKGVLEYFAPLFTWLKEQNKLLGAKPGWDDDIRCGDD